MRTRIVGIALLVAAGLYLATFAEPSAEPLPRSLPYVVRRPPPRGYFPSTSRAGDPGPEIRALHARGITGRGVGIAIIDSYLLTTHTDFRDRLRWYDEIDADPSEPAQWHGTACASIAAGRKYGVAPEADLYFIGLGANWKGQRIDNWLLAGRRVFTMRKRMAVAIRRVVALNRTLPADRRIRVLSMSVGLGQPFFGDSETRAAMEEARRSGLLLASADLRLKRLGPVVVASPEGPQAYTEFSVPAGSWAIAHEAGRLALELSGPTGMIH